jgi:DNA-binding HxlR family transcriptional regulator
VPVLPPSPHQDSDCRGVASILARVGDKWSVFVIMMLGDGPKRFNEIKRLIGGISQRMLTLTLRGLERDGLVTRTVFPTIPPRVDYELTDLGRGLSRPVEALGKWPLITGSRSKARGRNSTDAATIADFRAFERSMPRLPPDLWPGAIACAVMLAFNRRRGGGADEATDILADSRRCASARLHQWFHAAEGVSMPPPGADGLE